MNRYIGEYNDHEGKRRSFYVDCETQEEAESAVEWIGCTASIIAQHTPREDAHSWDCYRGIYVDRHGMSCLFLIDALSKDHAEKLCSCVGVSGYILGTLEEEGNVDFASFFIQVGNC